MAGPIIIVAALAFRRWWLARDVFLAGALALGLVLALEAAFADLLGTQGASAQLYPLLTPVSVFAFSAAAAPYFSQRVQHWFWSSASVLTVIAYATTLPLTLSVLGSVALGWTIGYAVHVMFGRPSPSLDSALVVDRLAGIGMDVDASQISRVDDPNHVADFAIVQDDGLELFVKVRGRQDRDADWLFTLWRRIVLRTVEDEPMFAMPKQQMERQAFTLELARKFADVRVPEVVAAASADDATILVETRIDAVQMSRASLHSASLDAVLNDLWQQLGRLGRARIAHRDLGLERILVDHDDKVWITGFESAAFGATDRSIASDVAQLMAALAVEYGTGPVVSSAVATIDRDLLLRALPILQPAALPGKTRSALRHSKKLLKSLRHELADAIEGDPNAKEQLSRVQIRTLIAVVGIGVAVYVLAPQIAHVQFGQVLDQWHDSSWFYVGLAAGFGVATYYAAAAQVLGAVPGKLSLNWTVVSQLACEFMNVMTPAGLGGMGLTARYVYKTGFTSTQATLAASLASVASVPIHVPVFLIFLAFLQLTGTDGLSLFHLSGDVNVWIIVVVGVVVVGLIVVFSIRWTRTRIMKPIRAGLGELRDAVREPRRALLLFGGALGLIMAYAMVLYLSLLAFGSEASFIATTTIWLGGSVVVVIVPTPGGIGAVEAVLTAALIAVGVPGGTALVGVLMFRLITFWLPITPGYVAFRALSKSNRI